MTLPKWLAERLQYIHDPAQACRAGGLGSPTPNYGLPCVRGWIWWDDGSETFNDRCIFCGRQGELYGH